MMRRVQCENNSKKCGWIFYFNPCKALPCENKCEQTKRAKIFIPILSLEVIPRAKINKRNVDEYIILYESLRKSSVSDESLTRSTRDARVRPTYH